MCLSILLDSNQLTRLIFGSVLTRRYKSQRVLPNNTKNEFGSQDRIRTCVMRCVFLSGLLPCHAPVLITDTCYQPTYFATTQPDYKKCVFLKYPLNTQTMPTHDSESLHANMDVPEGIFYFNPYL